MSVTLSEESIEITNFLSTHHIGVLATADLSGVPHAATIYFTANKDLDIYFITKQETIKNHNLAANPQAALAVFEASTQSTVQIVGMVTKVENEAAIHEIYRQIMETSAKTSESSVPPVSRLAAGGYVGYRLTPTTIRLAVYTRPEHNRGEQLFDIVVPEGQSLES